MKSWKEAFRWESYSFRHHLPRIVFHDWAAVYGASGSNSKTDACQRTLTEAINMHFLLKTRRKKSTDLPWMNKGILKLRKNRKRLFVEEGGDRTAAWKAEKKRIDGTIRERKRGYLDTQRSHILTNDAGRNFYEHVKNFATFNKPKQFNVLAVLPGLTGEEFAEHLAAYF